MDCRGATARAQAASKALSKHRSTCSCCAAGALDLARTNWLPCIRNRVGEHETLHFGAVKRALPGLPQNVLTEQLRRLEQAGILHREPKPAARPQICYSLTARGQELKNALNGLRELGARWQHEDANQNACVILTAL